tara:strand:- start:350 stop:526 length:177 start_codon:yes stop_codon:yes gene_type:complete
MRKTREYKGCELESPIYRQIVAEGYYKDKINRDNCGLHSTMSMPINEYKTKRGKNSKI